MREVAHHGMSPFPAVVQLLYLTPLYLNGKMQYTESQNVAQPSQKKSRKNEKTEGHVPYLSRIQNQLLGH